MSVTAIEQPFEIFADIDGQPLEAGYVWVGQANLDPQTNPIPVFFDAALTIPAAQPIRTLSGYLSNSGTPARLYANSDYSIRVMNKNGSTIYSAANNDGQANLLIDDLASTAAGKGAELVGFKQLGTGAVNRTALAKMRESVSVRDFGAVGDGVTDDTAAIQQAIYSTSFSTVYFPPGTYRCTDTIYSYNGKALVGDNSNCTTLLFDMSTSKDGLVLGWRNTTAYANEAAFLAAISGLQDGWYLIGQLDLRLVKAGVQVATATRTVAPVSSSNAGYRVAGLRLSGVTTAKVRDLVVCDNLWKADLDNVWAFTAGGRGFVFTQGLHISTRGLRSDDTVSHGVDLTGGDTTSVVMIGGYHRVTHSGAGIKSDCLGLTLDGPILEGIGSGSGSDVYAPGIWINGGNATITQPYFEAVRGHNIFCQNAVVTVVGGFNNSGQGALNTRYAALVVTGTAKVHAAGAGYAPGGGNKQDIFVSKDATTNNVFFTGAGAGSITVLANNITDPLNYTGANYDVADTTALAALTGMTTDQTAHVRSDTAGQARNYVYSGTAWVKVSSHEFNGGYISRNPVDGTWRQYGEQLAIRAGNSLSAINYLRSVTFDAGTASDNVAGMQSGAAVAAHTAVTATKALGFTLPNYAGSTAKNFQVRFNTPLLPAGIVCQVNILGGTSVQIVVLNTTAASINLNADIRGQIVVERWVQDSD